MPHSRGGEDDFFKGVDKAMKWNVILTKSLKIIQQPLVSSSGQPFAVTNHKSAIKGSK